ncbi:MAG: YdcH family protein [Woeseiaceae bacterium]
MIDEKVDTECFKELERLRDLRISHRDLDYLIDRLSHDPLVDQLRIRRLKKRRLVLKDMITQLESELIPDLDA